MREKRVQFSTLLGLAVTLCLASGASAISLVSQGRASSALVTVSLDGRVFDSDDDADTAPGFGPYSSGVISASASSGFGDFAVANANQDSSISLECHVLNPAVAIVQNAQDRLDLLFLCLAKRRNVAVLIFISRCF